MRTVTTAFIPDVRVVIGYGQVKSHPSSHQLCLVTRLKQPCNTAQAAQLPEKKTRHSHVVHFFLVTGLLSPV
jgi:hypothetical protein